MRPRFLTSHEKRGIYFSNIDQIIKQEYVYIFRVQQHFGELSGRVPLPCLR